MRNSKIPKLLKSKILEPVAYQWRSLKKVPKFQNHERDVLDLGCSVGVQKNNYEKFQNSKIPPLRSLGILEFRMAPQTQSQCTPPGFWNLGTFFRIL